MNNKTVEIVKVASPSFPLLGLLGIAFIVLKLCGVIGWSWLWVTAPFWGPLAFTLGVVGVGLLIAFSACVLGGVGALLFWAFKRIFKR